jgi:amino acid transporter
MSKAQFARQLNLPETVAMSVALMAPTTAMVFVTPFLAQSAGSNVPLAFVVALIGVLIIGSSFGRLGRKYAHAGSAYGLVKDVLGPAFGVVAGWGLTFTYVLMTAALLAGTGEFTSLAIEQATGAHVPWSIPALVGAAIVLGFALNNVRISVRMMLLLEGASMLLIIGVGVLILGHSNLSAGTAVKPFLLNSNGITGIAHAMVFGFTSFLGFEGSATLGEESKDPKRMVPLAISFSALVGGLFFIFSSYTQTLGFGLSASAVHAFGADPAPLNTLIQKFSGTTFSAMVNAGAAISFFACAVATVNGSARILFALARDGYAPKSLAGVHERSNTPRAAVFVVFPLSLALLGLGVLLFNTPANVLGDMSGLGAFGALIAYGLVVIASLAEYGRTDLAKRKVFALALPVIGLALICWVLYSSVYPVPASPVNFFPYVTLAYFAAVIPLSLRHRKRSAPENVSANIESGELDDVVSVD